MTPTPEPDPVAARRARIARRVSLAKRVGYGLLLATIALFVAGAASDFPAALVDATVATLVAAVVILPLPIVVGYGIRAAERDDRRAGRSQG